MKQRRIQLSILTSLLAACDPVGGGSESRAEPTAADHERSQLSLEQQVEVLRDIKSRHVDDILAIDGVIGMGIGKDGGELVFLVLYDSAGPQPALPQAIEGVDVLPAPRRPLQLDDGAPTCGVTSPCHSEQMDLPVEMGNSGGWVSQTGSGACTIGFKACDVATNELVFVTNSHCNQNKTTCALAVPNTTSDYWVHPGKMDAGNTCLGSGDCSRIGDIVSHAAPTCGGASNLTDATKIVSPADMTSNAFRDIGFIQAFPGTPMVGDPVRKSGRTTGDTQGVITGIFVDIPVPASGGYCCGALTMHDQIEWLPSYPTAGGDSGSALLSDDGHPQIVGLHFGSAGGYSYANHIDNVLADLGIELNFIECLQQCVFESMANTLDDRQGAIDLGHQFREQVLEATPRGRVYVNIYYQISAEAVRIAGLHPSVLVRTATLFEAQRDAIETLIQDGDVALSQSDIDDIDSLLATYQNYASDSMSEALQLLRNDMQDPSVLAEFGVSVQ